MDTFTRSQISLSYERAGLAEAPTILFHHSLGANHRLWDRQVAMLSHRYQIVRFDCRGHGLSTIPPGPYEISQFGLDTLALMDHLGLSKVIFCGLSLGSMVGLWLGATAPERIDRLILAGASAQVADKKGFDARAAQLRSDGFPAIMDQLLARWFTPQSLDPPGGSVQAVRDLVGASPVDGYIASAHAVRDFDGLQMLPKIKGPLHLITGAQDRATPLADAQRIERAVRGASLAVIPDASHLAILEQPAAFDQALLQALAS